MIFLGIDPSINSTGICILNDRGSIIDCKSLNHNLEDPYRLSYIYDSLMTLYRNYLPDYICYERQVPQMRYNNSASSIVPLAELAGILKLSFLHYREFKSDYCIVRYPPEDIKKYATGNGKASKEEMISVVSDRKITKIKSLIPEWSVNDVVDAYHIADLCRVLVNYSKTSITKPIFNGKEYDLSCYLYYNTIRSDLNEESESK